MSRKIAWFIVFALALVALGWWIWPSKIAYTNLPPTATGPWIAFGDSLTSGLGAEAGQDYPAQLGARLGQTILNMGQPGNTTADGLQRLNQVIDLKPRVVLLCFGGNDVLQNQSSATMFANLATMIDRLQAEGTFVVLIGIRSTGLRDRNAADFKKLAKQKGAFYVRDILDGVLGHPQLMSDYIHPNDQGYAAIAARIERELAAIVPKLR